MLPTPNPYPLFPIPHPHHRPHPHPYTSLPTSEPTSVPTSEPTSTHILISISVEYYCKAFIAETVDLNVNVNVFFFNFAKYRHLGKTASGIIGILFYPSELTITVE